MELRDMSRERDPMLDGDSFPRGAFHVLGRAPAKAWLLPPEAEAEVRADIAKVEAALAAKNIKDGQGY